MQAINKIHSVLQEKNNKGNKRKNGLFFCLLFCVNIISCTEKKIATLPGQNPNALTYIFTVDQNKILKNGTTVTSRKKEYSSKIGLNYDADISRPGMIATHGSMEFGLQKDIITNKDKTCPTSLTGQCDYRFPWEFL